MSEKSDITLKKAINKLSAKKNVVTETAKQAKKNLDDNSESLKIPPGQHHHFQKNVSTIHVFNDSVRLLTTIFQKSHFDRLALFIANPSKVLILNFLIGIVQGLGVALGIFFVSFLFVYFLRQNLSPHFLELVQQMSSYIFQG